MPPLTDPENLYVCVMWQVAVVVIVLVFLCCTRVGRAVGQKWGGGRLLFLRAPSGAVLGISYISVT
jgi:hypothetical protein